MEEDGGEDAWGRMVGRATSPLHKKVVKGALPARGGRVGVFVSAICLLEATSTPMAQRGVLDGVVTAILVGTVSKI